MNANPILLQHKYVTKEQMIRINLNLVLSFINDLMNEIFSSIKE